MPQLPRGVLCKVSAQEELEILRQARLDAQRIIGRIGLLYGDVGFLAGPEGEVKRRANRLVSGVDFLICMAEQVRDDEAATDDLFARAARTEEEEAA